MPALVRTSLTHPIRINELHVGSCGGRVGITFCPGKWGDSLTGLAWQRDLQQDLDRISQWQPSIVITLMETEEMLRLNVGELGAAVTARGWTWLHLPITDVQAPDERFIEGWRLARAAVHDCLNSGGRVLVHCRGGLGRAGTVAACILTEHGMAPDTAIQAVRLVRPGAIETRAQAAYVHSHATQWATMSG